MGFEYNSGTPRNTSPLFGIPTDTATIAERLKRAGYATAMFGKWHVGFEPDRVPTARGFDTFYGFLSGQHDYTARPSASGAGAPDARAGRWGGGQTMLRETTPEQMPAHTTEAFAAEAVHFLDATVLLAQMVRLRLCPPAAPAFGQQSSIFQQNTRETRPPSFPLMDASGLTEPEDHGLVRLP